MAKGMEINGKCVFQRTEECSLRCSSAPAGRGLAEQLRVRWRAAVDVFLPRGYGDEQRIAPGYLPFTAWNFMHQVGVHRTARCCI